MKKNLFQTETIYLQSHLVCLLNQITLQTNTHLMIHVAVNNAQKLNNDSIATSSGYS